MVLRMLKVTPSSHLWPSWDQFILIYDIFQRNSLCLCSETTRSCLVLHRALAEKGVIPAWIWQFTKLPTNLGAWAEWIWICMKHHGSHFPCRDKLRENTPPLISVARDGWVEEVNYLSGIKAELYLDLEEWMTENKGYLSFFYDHLLLI